MTRSIIMAITLALALAWPAIAADSRQPVVLPILGVYDGDTLYSLLPGAPERLRRISIRVYGIDTPERSHRAKCDGEREMADRARELLLSRWKTRAAKTALHGR